MLLTEEQKRRYEDDGFLQVEGICQVNRIHSQIAVNCRLLLYAISMT